MSFFKKRIQKPTEQVTGPIEYIIVGLGNPGRDYENTRHNAGFLCLDMLCEKKGIKIDRLKFKSLTADTMINSHRCILMKPSTYMNNSGDAVLEAAQFYKIPIENIVVIYDDAALPLGALRIRRKGSDGGHKGIRSIIEHFNNDNFPRLKLGIGQKPHEDADIKDFVLSSFSKSDAEAMKAAMSLACEALELIVDGQVEAAMNKYSK